MVSVFTFYKDIIRQEEENEQSCILARRNAGIQNPEEGPSLDCETECPLYDEFCPVMGADDNEQ
jgi:hypothetical protein